MSLESAGNLDNDAENRPDSSGPNTRERLEVSSGFFVAIDQFMLGNEQFLSQLEQSGGSGNDVRAVKELLSPVVKKFGGSLIATPAKKLSVQRDPYKTLIYLVPVDETEIDPATIPPVDTVLNARESARCCGRVFVDTRCIVFLDARFLLERDLLIEYQTLRRRGEDKRARDLIRENGGAVRYGFQKYGDELGVFDIPDLKVTALWPDVIETKGHAE